MQTHISTTTTVKNAAADECQLPGRTEVFGARSRGQTFRYLPEDLTIVGTERFAAWCREQFGAHGPRVLTDPNHAAQALFDPRLEKVFEPEWLDGLQALAADVKVNGVEQPIGFHLGELVGGSPTVFVVYGRRRVIAAALANKALREQGAEPDDLVKLEGKQKRGKWNELRLAMLAENDNRENNPPSVQAENVYQAVVQKQQDIRRVANRMGKPVAFLERLLDLRECEEAVIRAVDDGTIPLEAATDLRKLPPAKQVKQAARMAAAPAKSPRAATTQIRQENPEHAMPAPPPAVKRRQALLEEKAAVEKRLSDPKHDAFRRSNLAVLQTLKWVLGEDAAAPSTWKGGPPTT